MENITGLLAASKTNFVQVFGYKMSGRSVSCQVFNLTNKLLISNPFEYVLSLLGDQLMSFILKNFMVSYYRKNNENNFLLDLYDLRKEVSSSIEWTNYIGFLQSSRSFNDINT